MNYVLYWPFEPMCGFEKVKALSASNKWAIGSSIQAPGSYYVSNKELANSSEEWQLPKEASLLPHEETLSKENHLHA